MLKVALLETIIKMNLPVDLRGFRVNNMIIGNMNILFYDCKQLVGVHWGNGNRVCKWYNRVVSRSILH